MLAPGVESFVLRYLLDDDTWVSKVQTKDLNRVIAVQYQWSASDTGQVYHGIAATTDQMFAAYTLELPPAELNPIDPGNGNGHGNGNGSGGGETP